MAPMGVDFPGTGVGVGGGVGEVNIPIEGPGGVVVGTAGDVVVWGVVVEGIDDEDEKFGIVIWMKLNEPAGKTLSVAVAYMVCKVADESQ
jgi:hypothetical protein